MKKWLIWLTCVAMLVAVTACGDDAGNQPTEDTAPSTSQTDVVAPSGDATTPTTEIIPATSSSSKKSTGTTDKIPEASDNVVDWDDVWGDETTTTQKGDPTKTTTSTKKTTTTTTAKPTTQKPTTIDKVELPAVGTDVDGRGRIAVSKVALEKGVMTLSIRNNTDKQTQKWITEETNYVTYACYDANGKELKGKDGAFGYFYLGCLEAGDEIEFKVTLPAGTAKVELTGSKIVYWTPWS